MSISARQIMLVQESFAKVAPISEKAAEIFYKRLFEYDPALKPLFKSGIKAQGKMLMSALTMSVDSLSNLNALIPELEKLAQRHVKYGVKPEDYTPVGNALLYTLKQGLGDDFTPEVRKAWVDTFRLMATVMKKHAYG
ncbi:MAG: hemin receptor [Hahellaceae bacterium]|nr:hemin receptor [Hahellaceae bacterium]MCP5212499.1 hemin receptor [Hahellaceae bacterium]